MVVWEINKLILFILFFIPGFISIKVYDLIIAGERRDFSKSIYEAIGFSALNFAALSWLIILIHSGDFYNHHKFLYGFYIFLILFISPIFWPIFFSRLSKWKFFSKYIIHLCLKPWDYIFSKREPFWIIIHLKNGIRIAGKYDSNSFASSFPAEEQIYLEELWKLDNNGKFTELVERSKGIIISNSEISSIEFFK